MKTYLEGRRFPGRIDRTYLESEQAFPVGPEAPADAPNIVYIILGDVGLDLV
jgi:arylsulfatase